MFRLFKPNNQAVQEERRKKRQQLRDDEMAFDKSPLMLQSIQSRSSFHATKREAAEARAAVKGRHRRQRTEGD